LVKKIAIAVFVGLVLGIVGLALWARSVLTGDNVRTAIAAQVSEALGQPVTIGGIGASIYPRVMVDLTDVAIGRPARIRLQSLHLGTDFRALVSRRIEQAKVKATGARIELPLLTFTVGGSAGASAGSAPPVEIVSIEEIVLEDVEVVSGGRTLRGDIELVPEGKGVVLRRVALDAEDASITATGTLTSLSPIDGTVEARAAKLNFDRLVAFFNEFAGASAPTDVAAGSPRDPQTTQASSGIGRVEFALTADEALAGGLRLTTLSTTALVTPAGVTLDPMAFGLFGGRYEGTMRVSADAEPRFEWNAKVSGMHMADIMRFAGSPGTITGTLAGTLALDGAGLDMERALRTSRGTARIDVTDGTMAGLSLVRTVVTSLSGRGGITTSATSGMQASTSGAGGNERFSRLGATLALGGGTMRTNDFAMTSPDVDLTGTATLNLARMAADMKGRVQLSQALSKQAGTDLYRYTQEGGRVTLPATISGPLDNLSVRVDIGAAATRAIQNKATEEIDRAIKRNLPGGLGGLFPKPKK
jgi:uncharacterized protein involved in outer membrane biogenesis